MKKYFYDIEKYEAIYTSAKVSKSRYCIPDGFSMTRNLMSFNLGFPTGWNGKDLSYSKRAINQFLNLISEKFSLVMITEYFIESLILMRRTLSWVWKDIIHMAKNKGQYTKIDPSTVDPELVQMYKEYSKVDVTMYAHFNRTLWQKILSEGNDFHGEVVAFKRALSKTIDFCETKSNDKVELKIMKSRWDDGFEVSLDDCKMLKMPYLDIMKLYTRDKYTAKKKQGSNAYFHHHNLNSFC